MPQPQFSGTPVTCKFGGLALPGGVGTMAQINLNDVTSWFLQDFQADLSKQIAKGALVWRSRGVVLGRDVPGFAISLPFKYKEASNGAFGAALGTLINTGDQQLTFDNNTYILAELESTKSRKLWIKFQPYWWDVTLAFWCKTPWFVDVAATNMTAVTSIGTSTSNFNLTYNGSVFAEPVFTLTIGAGNPAVITTAVLKNTTSGENLTITFPGGLAASTAYTITIDCGAFSVTDQNSVGYDVSGSFPLLYPPVGTVNACSVALTVSSGVPSNVSLNGTWNNRWVM
jgi:hypothetical protein